MSSTENVDVLSSYVKHWSDTLPDRELFVFYQGDVRTSYTCRRVYELAGRFARRLREDYGFQKGDIIANSLPNSSERLFTDLGIVLAGCISLTIEAMFSDGSDFMTSARNSGLRGVIVSPEGDGPAWKILGSYVTTDLTSPTGHILCDRAPGMRTVIFVGRHTPGILLLKDLEADNGEVFVEDSVQPEDVAVVMTTSGSTGYCKLVPRTHSSLIVTWQRLQDFIRAKTDLAWTDVTIYNDRSLGWIAGFPIGSYINGDTRILLDVWETKGIKVKADVSSIISQEKITCGLFMPLDMENILRPNASFQGVTSKIPLILCGGQPIRKSQHHDYLQIGAHVLIVYASTETAIISVGLVDAAKSRDYFCGQVIPGKELRVVREDGTECRPGEIGTIHVRGAGVFQGYLNRVEDPDPKTVSAFTPDGWFKMDDTGYLDEDNNLYCLGRLKDVINFGSTFIYPGWLEPKIVAHPEIVEAIIVPVSDPVLYQNICAIVQTVPGSQLNEEGLRKIFEDLLMDDKDIEGTPVPSYYLILDSIPKNVNGKVDRKFLLNLAEEKFGVKQKASSVQ